MNKLSHFQYNPYLKYHLPAAPGIAAPRGATGKASGNNLHKGAYRHMNRRSGFCCTNRYEHPPIRPG